MTQITWTVEKRKVADLIALEETHVACPLDTD